MTHTEIFHGKEIFSSPVPSEESCGLLDFKDEVDEVDGALVSEVLPGILAIAFLKELRPPRPDEIEPPG
jgi:hypothetical protein